ncbi:MAG: carbon-nitrogen hydrolase [Paenibacillus sp.]|nr:carbon-nitrogen hydrolase [Paenibacillus sp.]
MLVQIAVVALAIEDRVELVPDVPVQAVERVLQQLEGRGADLILFPQYTTGAGRVDSHGEAVAMAEEEAEAERIPELLTAFAVRNRCYVVYNELRAVGERNRCVSVVTGRDGSFVGEYVKSHSVDGIDIPLELGDHLPVFELDFGKVALLAGSDLLVPELAELYSIAGADLLLCSLGTQLLRDDTETHRLLKGRAVADYCWVAASTYASTDALYMTNNVEAFHTADAGQIDVSKDAGATFNAFGLGKHAGRAAVFDTRGETIASTGRESGCAIVQLDLERKRNLAKYNYGTGRLLIHQNERGVFRELASRAEYSEKRYPCEKPAISFVHMGYKDTIRTIGNDDDYRKVLASIGQAAAYSDMVICSEYSRGDNGKTETAGLRRFLQGCSDIAGRCRCYVAVNDVVDGFNTTLLFGRDGSLLHTYRKVNTLGMMYHNKLPAGDEIGVVELDFATVGFMICADSYCQEIPRILALKGAEVIVLQSQSWGYDANAINEGMSRAWAIENAAYVLMSNFPSSQVAHRSNVIDPTGETIFATTYNKEGLYTFRLDLDAVRSKPLYELDGRTVRKRHDMRARLMKARRPELYGLLAGQKKGGMEKSTIRKEE